MNHDSLVMTLLMLQFDLQEFDEWLDTLGDCPARQELQHRRDKLVARVSAGKVIRYNAADDDSEPAIKRELEFLMGRRREIQREDALLPAARMGAEYSQVQSERGTAGANVRWNSEARQAVDDLIEKLKGRRYEDLRASEKWEELLSLMQDVRYGEDREPLEPNENWVHGNADKSTINYRGDGGKPLTYKTFKNRLSS